MTVQTKTIRSKNIDKIRTILKERYTTIKNSNISSQTLYDWDKEGLPEPVKKFFLISKKTKIDPDTLFEMLSSD
jgi:hypothetical protein